MKIAAAGKRIVVQIIPQEEKPQKGILLIEREKKELHAVVIAVGSEVDKNVQEGDIIILPGESGVLINIDDEIYFSIADNQVLAILKDN